MIFVFILSMLIFKRNYRALQFTSLTIVVIGLLVFSTSDIKEADSEEEKNDVTTGFGMIVFA